MRLVGRIALPSLEMAGRILSLRCWCNRSCVLPGGGSAEALSERGEGFHPFERWSQIADQLQNAEC